MVYWRKFLYERAKARAIKKCNKLALKNNKRYWVLYMWGKFKVMDSAEFKRRKKKGQIDKKVRFLELTTLAVHYSK